MEEIITDETKLKEAFLNYIECITKLKQENEELKTVHKQLKQLKKLYDELINRVCLENYERLEQENKELKVNFAGQKNAYRQLNCQYKELKQALEEIREILKGNKDGDIDEMIDKINEVLK